MNNSDADFYAKQDRQKMLADIHAKLDRGDRITRNERVELFADVATEMARRLFAEMKRVRTNPDRANEVAYTQGVADSIRRGFSLLIGEVLAVSCQQAEKRAALEDRVAALEATGIKFCGTYVRGAEYARGSITTCDGAAWTALRQIKPNEKPGEGDGWHLLAAKGKDCKDRR